MMADSDHPRLHLRHFLSLNLCNVLEFIHRSCSAVGYRPYVLSTTLAHLIATDCGHLILPLLSIRDRLKEKAEDFFGCEFELFVEFTGFISYGNNFEGGTFPFKDGEPSSVLPVARDVLMYTADSRNIHSVDEVLDGERLTRTLWFTRNNEHDEDAKLISLLSQRLFNCEVERTCLCLPSSASDNMYWFSHDQSGFDIRHARLEILGFQFFSSANVTDSSSDSLELLNKPLQLGRDDKIFDEEFANALHALQVVQFYNWKAPLLPAASRETGSNTRQGRSFLMEKSRESKLVLPCDCQLVEIVFRHSSCGTAHISFSWDDFRVAVEMW